VALWLLLPPCRFYDDSHSSSERQFYGDAISSKSLHYHIGFTTIYTSSYFFTPMSSLWRYMLLHTFSPLCQLYDDIYFFILLHPYVDFMTIYTSSPLCRLYNDVYFFILLPSAYYRYIHDEYIYIRTFGYPSPYIKIYILFPIIQPLYVMVNNLYI